MADSFAMTPEEIIQRLHDLTVPHAEIAKAIGRERSAATKLMGGKRRMAADEIGKLERLVKRHEKHVLTAAPTDENAFDDFAPNDRLPIRGQIQAGAWLELDPQQEPVYETYPVAPDLRFPAKAQWIARVRGDSMNALTKNGQPAGILDGDFVHLVDAIAIDYQFRSGDIVEVERSRFQGREREYTLKQVELKADGSLLLWPRSTNPRWSGAVPYEDGDRDDVEVRVRAKLLQVLRTY